MKNFLRLTFFFAIFFMTHLVFSQGETRANLEKQIQSVAQLKDQAYVSGRKELEAKYRQDPKPFDQLAQTSQDWQVRLLCGIVSERVNKASAIAEFLQQELKVPFDKGRGWEMPYIRAGKALAEHGKEVPMFLAEGFWKTNELMEWWPKHLKATAYPIECVFPRAFGNLKLMEVRELLEAALNPSFYIKDFDRQDFEKQKSILVDYSHSRRQVAWALGEIGSPKSMPALIHAIETKERFHYNASADDNLGISLGQCMEKADKSMLPFLKQKAVETKSAPMKEYLENKIRSLEKGDK